MMQAYQKTDLLDRFFDLDFFRFLRANENEEYPKNKREIIFKVGNINETVSEDGDEGKAVGGRRWLGIFFETDAHPG